MVAEAPPPRPAVVTLHITIPSAKAAVCGGGNGTGGLVVRHFYLRAWIDLATLPKSAVRAPVTFGVRFRYRKRCGG